MYWGLGTVVDACVFADSYLIVCSDNELQIKSNQLDTENLRKLTSDGRSARVYAAMNWHIVGFTVDSRGCVLVMEFTYDTGETRLRLLSFGDGATKTRALMTKDLSVGV